MPLTRPPASPLRVLVVDDDVDGAQVLCALLQSMGCTTAIAFDGEHGLDIADRFDPHLALIDFEMPGLCGCDVARRFRAGHPGRSTTLICLTGRGGAEDRRLCFDAGFDTFFNKPMAAESLVDAVAAANAERLR